MELTRAAEQPIKCTVIHDVKGSWAGFPGPGSAHALELRTFPPIAGSQAAKAGPGGREAAGARPGEHEARESVQRAAEQKPGGGEWVRVCTRPPGLWVGFQVWVAAQELGTTQWEGLCLEARPTIGRGQLRPGSATVESPVPSRPQRLTGRWGGGGSGHR